MTYNRCFTSDEAVIAEFGILQFSIPRGDLHSTKSKKEEVDKQVILTTLIYDTEKLGGYPNGNNARNVYRVFE